MVARRFPSLGAVCYRAIGSFVQGRGTACTRVHSRVFMQNGSAQRAYGWNGLERPARILITGATGFIGAFLTAEMLRAGHEVWALSRRTADALDVPIRYWLNGDSTGRLHVIDGDISRPLCGVPESDINALRGMIDETWHLAATTEFGYGVGELQQEVNLGGTRHVIALTEALGVPHLVYASTLSVCDPRAESATEIALPPERETFRNPYELSKAGGERLVFESAERRQGTTTIVRLPVTTGCSESGGPLAGTPFSFVGLTLQNVTAAREVLDGPRTNGSREPLGVPTGPEATLNVLPVDIVAKTMMRIGEGARSKFDITHVANLTPPSVRHIVTSLCRFFEVDEVKFLAPGSTEGVDRSRGQRLLLSRLAAYLPYMEGEPAYCTKRLRAIAGSQSHPEFDVTYEYIAQVLACELASIAEHAPDGA